MAVRAVLQGREAQVPGEGPRRESTLRHLAQPHLHPVWQELLHQEQPTEPHDLVPQGRI